LPASQPAFSTITFARSALRQWRDVLPELSALVTGAPQQLRLAPTARSQLR
jgi:hypothetical protein